MNNPFEELKPPAPKKRRLFPRIRANFLAGLAVLVPIALTLYLLWTFIGWIDSWVLPFVPAAYQPDTLAKKFFGPDASVNIRGVGVVFFFVFTLIIGWIAKGFFGRSVLAYAESLVDRMPVVRSVYNGLKQIAETVFTQQETSFETACLVEYPRKGLWAVAFISTRAKGEVKAKVPRDEEIISVFLPTTPNPTSGFLLYVPKSDVIELDMSIEDAAKLVISAGLVYPPPKDPALPAAQDAEKPA